jgi:hypothetical protein
VKRGSVIKVVVPLVMMAGLGIALADKLSDFKNAASNDGCESIPYSDYRSTCSSQQSPVHDWCDGGRGAVSCPGGESGTRQIKDAVDKAQRALEAAKDAKRSADSNRSKSNLTDDQKRAAEEEYKKASETVDQSEKALEQTKKDLEARGKLVSEAIYNIDKCLDYRRAVMNVFSSAQDRVRNENDPPEIIPYARQLRDKWEVSKPGHVEAITGKENALARCKDARP